MKTPPQPTQLDAVDRRILKRMQLDARVPNQDLAAAVELSPSGCLHRVRKLEESGVITRYLTEIDEHAFVGWMLLWGEIALTAAGRSARDAFEAALHAAAEIIEARRMVGKVDYLLRVAGRDASVWPSLLLRLDPDGVFIRKASVQVEAGVAKKFAGLPQIEG